MGTKPFKTKHIMTTSVLKYKLSKVKYKFMTWYYDNNGEIVLLQLTTMLVTLLIVLIILFIIFLCYAI